MASPSNQELIKKLEARVSCQDKEVLSQALQSEKLRCQNLTLTELQEEKIVTGKFQGKSCLHVYQHETAYVVWLLQHQGNSPKFQNIFELSRRLEKVKAEPTISPQGYPSKPEMTSGRMPNWSPPGSDWEEMSNPPAAAPTMGESSTVEMMKTLASALGDIQTKLGQLTINQDLQQTAIQNTHSMILQVQQTQAVQVEKISELAMLRDNNS